MAMLVNAVSPRVEYVATALQTVFVVPFEFILEADLEVYVDGVAATFTASGMGTTGGGSVTLSVGAALGADVIIYRNTEIKRLTDFPLNGPFDIEQLNLELDNITMILQELREFDSRVLFLDPTVPFDEANWDAGGRRIINVGDAIDAKDAVNRDIANAIASEYAGEGSGGGTGGGGDSYTTVQIDTLLQALETELTTLIDASITTNVTTALAAALANSYRIRSIVAYSGPGSLALESWVKAYRVIGCGGGGGGGYAAGEAADEIGAGNGGGGAVTGVSPITTVAASGATILTVAIGAGGVGGKANTLVSATKGGNTSVVGGTFSFLAEGGYGGGGGGSTNVDGRASSSPGGGGISVTGGQYTIPGHNGERGVIFGVDGTGFGGSGGNSFFGKGGNSLDDNGGGNGGTGYGAGGGGAFSVGTSKRNGGAGSAGYVLIELYE